MGAYVGMVIIFGLSIYVAVAVLARYILGQPFPGVVEWAGFMMVIIVFLGLAYTLEEDRHIRVEWLTSRLHGKTLFILSIISMIVVAFVATIFLWKGGQLALGKLHTLSSDERIPVFPFYIFMPIGGALLLVQALRWLFSSLARVISREGNSG